MSGTGQETLPVVRERSGDFPVCPEMFRDPPGILGVVAWPSRLSGSGREKLPDDREWSGGPPGCPGVVGRHAGCPVVVERLFQMSGTGRETLPDIQEALSKVRECSEGPPK